MKREAEQDAVRGRVEKEVKRLSKLKIRAVSEEDHDRAGSKGRQYKRPSYG